MFDDLTKCAGVDCLRRYSCERFVVREYFGKQAPFISTLCRWEGKTYFDEYVPLESVELNE